MECEPELKVINERRTTHDYKINTNVSIGRMKNTVILMFLFSDNWSEEEKINYITQSVEELTSRFLKNIEPIRPKRTSKRKKRKRNQRGKYRTLNNYKSKNSIID